VSRDSLADEGKGEGKGKAGFLFAETKHLWENGTRGVPSRRGAREKKWSGT